MSSALEQARDALHAFVASQGWIINSDANQRTGSILAIIKLPPVEICSKCGRETSGKDFASLGLNMVLCSDCYEG